MATAQLTRFTADSVSKLGMIFPPQDSPIGAMTPYLRGPVIDLYSVPTGSRFKAKCMTVSIRPEVNNTSPLNAPNGQGGTVFASINGVAMFERPFYGNILPAYVGADEQQQAWSSASGSPSVGEGVVCSAGQVLLITATPRQATLMVWRVTVTGRLGSTTDIRTALVQTGTTTGNQTLLTYTPASDYTVLSISVECEQPGHIFGGLEMRISGCQIFEAGFLGYEAAIPAFMDDHCYAGPGVGALIFPLWGMTFGEGQTFQASPNSFSDNNGNWIFTVFGTEEVIGGGPPSAGAVCYAF